MRLLASIMFGASCAHGTATTLPISADNTTAWYTSTQGDELRRGIDCAARERSGIVSPTRASDQLVMTSDHRHGSLACVVDGHAAPSAFAMEIRLVPREEGTHVQTSMRGSYVLGRRRFSCAHGSPGIHEEYLECDTNGVEQAAFLTSLRRCLGDVGDPVRFRPPRVPP